MSNPNKTKVYTLKELREKAELEKNERLKNGVRVDKFRVYFQPSNLTIQIEENDIKFYEVDLERCNDSNELLDWIFHIHSKTWSHLLETILLVLDDACEEVFGKNAKSLFQSGQTLNWRFKTVSKRVKIDLDVSPELYTTLNYLSQKIQGDTADVLLNAISLMEIAVEAEDLGKNLWIVDKDKNLETEIVGFLQE